MFVVKRKGKKNMKKQKETQTISEKQKHKQFCKHAHRFTDGLKKLASLMEKHEASENNSQNSSQKQKSNNYSKGMNNFADNLNQVINELEKSWEKTNHKLSILSYNGKTVISPVEIEKAIIWSFPFISESRQNLIKIEKYTNPKTDEDINTAFQCYLDYVLGAAPEEDLQKNNVIIKLPRELKKHVDYFEKHFVAVRKNNSIYAITKNECNNLSVMYIMPAHEEQITYLGDYTVKC